MSYLAHLKANWRVAKRALAEFRKSKNPHDLNDCVEHWLHGLIPIIHWKHYQPPENDKGKH